MASTLMWKVIRLFGAFSAVALLVMSPYAQPRKASAAPTPCLTIAQKYESMKGMLGRVTQTERDTRYRTGRYAVYERGWIYWSPATCAQQTQGAIFDKWAGIGWETSFLGFPVTDHLGTPTRPGAYQHFQGGSIYWSAQTGAHIVRGAIRDRWARAGWEREALGFPTSDELATNDGVGRFQTFQGGTIYWHPDMGTTIVRAARKPSGGIRLQSNDLGAAIATRKVSVSGTIYIVDDENWPFKDERASVPVNANGFASAEESPLLQIEGCAGDEVRVTLDLTVLALENGAVLVTGPLRLYEGTDCATDDLEHEQYIRLLVPANRQKTQTFNLYNSGFGGGDTARIELQISNKPA